MGGGGGLEIRDGVRREERGVVALPVTAFCEVGVATGGEGSSGVNRSGKCSLRRTRMGRAGEQALFFSLSQVASGERLVFYEEWMELKEARSEVECGLIRDYSRCDI